MGLGLEVEAGRLFGARRLRRAVLAVGRRHGLAAEGDDEELWLQGEDVAVEVRPDPEVGGLTLELELLDDGPQARQRFADVLRDLVRSLDEAGGTVRESDGGARVTAETVGELLP
jgi:hypothetical protein